MYDTLESVPVQATRLSADSFCVVGQFLDDENRPMHRPVVYQWGDDSLPAMTDEKGELMRVCKLGTYLLIVNRSDTFMVTPSMGGDTLSITWNLPLKELKGRVMETDGTPLRDMPLHIHYKTLGKKKRGWKDSFVNDELIHTDSMGYYLTYVPANSATVSLRTCGFLVGTVSRYELIHYPMQNFLYEPFNIENAWGDYVPPYQHRLVVVATKDTIPMDDWAVFFSYDSLLESVPSIRWIATSEHGTTRKNIRKQNAVFRNASFKVFVRYAE